MVLVRNFNKSTIITTLSLTGVILLSPVVLFRVGRSTAHINGKTAPVSCKQMDFMMSNRLPARALSLPSTTKATFDGY